MVRFDSKKYQNVCKRNPYTNLKPHNFIARVGWVKNFWRCKAWAFSKIRQSAPKRPLWGANSAPQLPNIQLQPTTHTAHIIKWKNMALKSYRLKGTLSHFWSKQTEPTRPRVHVSPVGSVYYIEKVSQALLMYTKF